MSFRLKPGCCCLAGPWDWYHDFAGGQDGTPPDPETLDSPYLARTASIYATDPPEDAPEDYDSYDDWFVTIANSGVGTNFQNKSMVSSLTPAGSVATELVYVYVVDNGTGGTGEQGMLQVDAAMIAVDWIVMDDDWTDDSEPIMGSVSISANSWLSPGAAPAWDTFEPNSYALAGFCAHTGGLRRIEITSSGTYPNLHPNSFTDWTVSTAGAKSYNQQDFYSDYLAGHGGDPLDYPEYSELFSDEEEGPWTQQFNAYALPVGHAPQGNLAIGVVHPNFFDLFSGGAPTPPEGLSEFDATAEVHVGAVAFDADNLPYVTEGQIWSLTKTYVGGYRGIAINVRVDGFDGIVANTVQKTIAIVTYRWRDDWVNDGSSSPVYQHNTMIGKTALVVDGAIVSDVEIFETTNIAYGTPTSVTDKSTFFPRWINPRSLHPTEGLQGGGYRHIVFSRVPFDQSEADSDWGSGTSLGNYWLRCYRNGLLNFSLASRWGRVAQATGTVSMDTTNSADITVAAVPGGEADGTASNGTLTIEITDGTPEDAVYTPGTNTLTVTADITGGHDTIDDVVAIIAAAGDFSVTSVTFGSDVVTHGTDGTGTLTGGDDSASGSVAANPPSVHDSSDRFFYLLNFPLRIRELVSGRWQCCFIAGTVAYPKKWMVSHDGTIANPAGRGLERFDRLEPSTFAAIGNTNFSSIKTSGLSPLSPAMDEQ